VYFLKDFLRIENQVLQLRVATSLAVRCTLRLTAKYWHIILGSGFSTRQALLVMSFDMTTSNRVLLNPVHFFANLIFIFCFHIDT
jgi:hypothetical protein